MTAYTIPRTLAIDPMRTRFWFVVFEGSERLVDWGVRDPHRPGDDAAFLESFEKLVAEHAPFLIVLEALAGSRRGALGRRRIAQIEAFATTRGIGCVAVSTDEVLREFADVGEARRHIAEAIARLFPELEAWLPRPRKQWTSEDERMNLFDAASMGLVVLRRQERATLE